MEITINLPERIFAGLSVVARNSRRRIDEVIADSLEQAFLATAADLDKQISYCSDKEVLQLAKIQMPVKQDRRLSKLLQKQGETTLTAKEQNELWELMDLNRITTLKKAFALREVTLRGLPHEQNWPGVG